MPPVNGFWSLTMYDGHRFFVPNALNRYTLSQRDDLVTNADNSVDIYLQANSPGKVGPRCRMIVFLEIIQP